MKIIGLVGQAESGKGATADLIIKHLPGAVKMSLSAPIKNFAKEILDLDDRQLWGPSEARNEPDPRYSRTIKDLNGRVVDTKFLTARYVCQFIGTEIGRAFFEDIWIDYLLRKANAAKHDIIVIDDVRFPNEAVKIKKDGVLWRINRNVDQSKLAVAGIPNHASEKSQFSPEMTAMIDLEIDNNGTLQDLENNVIVHLNKLTSSW